MIIDNQLLSDFYNEPAPDDLVSQLNSDQKTRLLNIVIEYYRTHTARETCEFFGVQLTPKITKLLHRIHPKGAGWGGSRRGSGNKKGVKFDPVTRKKI